jgi:hypothetical protein
MPVTESRRRGWRSGATATLVMSVLVLGSASLAGASSRLTKLSTDPYRNTDSQHRTQVEPDNFAFGKTVVSVFQVGRIFGGGSANIGWATSTDSGHTWKHGFLPSTTVNATPKGPDAGASDPSVAYDPKHKVWMTSYLGLLAGGVVDVQASRSVDGIHWTKPVTVAHTGTFFDKNWTVCDITATSPFYGNCYTEFDDVNQGDLELLSTSRDGGQTWGAAVPTADRVHGLGGQPLVQANGTVVVPFAADAGTISSFSSTNGGVSLTHSVTISAVQYHPQGGNLRSGALPSAEIDSAGKVYVTWGDCRFQSGCSADDAVLSTSTDGHTWSAVKRIPIDPVGSGIDHFIPGIAVDKATSGATARLAVTYYYYPKTNCTAATCQLDVGFVSSVNGGTSWSAATQLGGPMQLSWIADTSQGRMVGDYISTAIPPGTSAAAVPAVVMATAPTGGKFNESAYSGQVAVTGGSRLLAADPVLSSGGPRAVDRLRTSF